MSRVTNLIVATSISEDSSYLEKTFNDFKVDESPFNLVSVESEKLPNAWYGGSKFLEVNLFVGAYNYLDLDSLLVFMKNQIKWEMPESVQIIVKEHEDTKFRIINLFPE